MLIQIINEINIDDALLQVGNQLETIPCPIDHSHLSMVTDQSVWIHGTKEPIRILNHEYKIVELNQQEAIDFDAEVSGKQVTFASRLNYLKGNTKNAKEILKSVGCDTKTIDAILMGQAELVSTNKLNYTLVERVDNVYIDLMKKTMKQYFFFNGKFYHPIGFVADYGYIDEHFHINFSIDKNELGTRASFYVQRKTDIIAHCVYDTHEFNIIFKKATFDKKLSKYASTSAQEAMDNFYNFDKNAYLENMGFSAYCYNRGDDDCSPDILSPYEIAFREEEEREKEEERKRYYAEKNERDRQEIIERAENFLGFFDLTFSEGTFRVPLAPFMIWFAPSYRIMHDQIETLRLGWGNPVCGTNYKMQNDSRHHNDWMLGADMDFENYYKFLNDDETGLRDAIDAQIQKIINSTSANFEIMHQADNSNDRVFIKPIFQNEETKAGDCIVVERGDARDIDRILDATANGNGFVVTTKSTQVAHLVSNAMELNFSMINAPVLNQSLLINDDVIYEVNFASNEISMISDKGTPLSILEHGDSKAHMLAYLYSKGIRIVDGFFIDDISDMELSLNPLNQYIVRSSGIGEGASVKASGLFDSIIADSDNVNEAVKTVWDSFSSSIATKYLERINGQIKEGILIQPFIKADTSFVVKQLNDTVYVSFIDDDCSKIVNGEDGVQTLSFPISELDDFKNEFPVLNTFENIKDILNVDNLECEFILKNNVIYTLQAMKV